MKLLLKYPLNYSYIYQDGTWNGGIKDIIDGVADIGAAYFTASHLRSKVVDFTIPIDEESLTIFLKNPKLSFSWTRLSQVCNEKRSIEDRVLKVTTQIERKRKQWTVFEKKEGTEPTQGLS